MQAIKTMAKKVDDTNYEINGQKMWVTNGLRLRSRVPAGQDRPGRKAPPQGLHVLHRREGAGRAVNTGEYKGFNVPPQLKKMGYKGVESTELVLDGYLLSG